MRNGRHPVAVEERREQAHHHLAVFEHVAHTAGHAQVVLQHVVLALPLRIGRAHNVNARYVRVNLVRNRHTHHLFAKLGVVLDLLARHDASLDDVLVVVNVVDKAVERGDALHQAFFHGAPFVGRDDARNQVKRNQPLGARTVFVFFAVHSERDANAAENHLSLFTPVRHGLSALLGKPLAVGLVVFARVVRFIQAAVRQGCRHLVECIHRDRPSQCCLPIGGACLRLAKQDLDHDSPVPCQPYQGMRWCQYRRRLSRAHAPFWGNQDCQINAPQWGVSTICKDSCGP